MNTESAGRCAHETFRFTFATEGDKSVVGTVCCGCGHVLNDGVFTWPQWLSDVP